MASASKGNAALHESLLKRGAGAVHFGKNGADPLALKEDDDDEDSKAFKNQSIDDILATRTKAVVLALSLIHI